MTADEKLNEIIEFIKKHNLPHWYKCDEVCMNNDEIMRDTIRILENLKSENREKIHSMLSDLFLDAELFKYAQQISKKYDESLNKMILGEI